MTEKNRDPSAEQNTSKAEEPADPSKGAEEIIPGSAPPHPDAAPAQAGPQDTRYVNFTTTVYDFVYVRMYHPNGESNFRVNKNRPVSEYIYGEPYVCFCWVPLNGDLNQCEPQYRWRLNGGRTFNCGVSTDVVRC